MAKTKQSRIKRAEERIEAIVVEIQKVGHLLNLTMNTLNEYIAFKKDIKKFEKFIKDSQDKLEKEKESKD
jgi:DNA-binding protein YbaB